MKVIDFLHLSQGGDVVDQSLGNCPIAGLGIHPRAPMASVLPGGLRTCLPSKASVLRPATRRAIAQWVKARQHTTVACFDSASGLIRPIQKKRPQRAAKRRPVVHR
jgi:hypothetical protein